MNADPDINIVTGGKTEKPQKESMEKRVTQDMRVNSRVEVVKIIQQMNIIRGKMPIETRIYPLKAMQVVDIPDIAKNRGIKGDEKSAMRPAARGSF